MTPDEIIRGGLRRIELGYTEPKLLPDGRWCALMRFMFTAGLVVGIDERGNYDWRYCYERAEDASAALDTWDGTGHPSGPWIKRKGHPDGELSNTFKGINVVEER